MHYAAWADKYDGAVRAPDKRMLTLALNEPWDVMGISCPDEAPLLGFVSLVLPAIAMGNRVVVTPSPRQPLSRPGFLSGARHIRCTRRCGQHHHR
jgi:aldehyde dehydrogenase (NAD+)